MIRMTEEFRSCGYVGCFVTLTYNEDSVPRIYDKDTGCCYLSVCKKHPQSAIKRFRTSYKRLNGKDAPFKYFLTSEYGPRTCRPHYHAIFFGMTKRDLLPLLNDWRERYGYIVAKDVNRTHSAVAKYVAKYCSKGVFECPYVEQGFAMPTFRLMSKGLGSSYVKRQDVRKAFIYWPKEDKWQDREKGIYSDKYLDFVGFRLRVLVDNFSYGMPRYYKTKLYGTQNDLSRQVSDYVFRENMRLLDEKCAKVQADRHCSYSEALHIVGLQEDSDREQRERDTKEKFERFYNKSKL